VRAPRRVHSSYVLERPTATEEPYSSIWTINVRSTHVGLNFVEGRRQTSVASSNFAFTCLLGHGPKH
jgi:hypothetical protein